MLTLRVQSNNDPLPLSVELDTMVDSQGIEVIAVTITTPVGEIYKGLASYDGVVAESDDGCV